MSPLTIDPAHEGSAMSRALVVCADDFAMSDGITQAILHLAARQRITATSAMTLSGTWPDDAKRLHDMAPSLDVGLHLDWTSHHAIAAGHGQKLSTVMGMSALGWLDQVKARDVIQRQLDAFERHWKAPPSHIDGHQHVHQMHGIRQPLVDTLLQRYAHALPWLRISEAPAQQQTVKSRIISAWGAKGLLQLATRHGVPHARWLLGMAGFSPEAGVFEHKANHWLADCPAGALMMCHPAQGLDPNDPIAMARTHELAFLDSAAFPGTLARHRLQLAQGTHTFKA
ncbi:MAG: ChbG/HpnK family deacetylase [Burkholderiales bacterium]|nr:ChbG/HpnK family deacetylase [Burkholderiales bacterium]